MSIRVPFLLTTIPGAMPQANKNSEKKESIEELKEKTINDLKAIKDEYPGKKIPYSADTLVYGISSHIRYVIKSLEDNKLDKLYEHQRNIRECYLEAYEKYKAYYPFRNDEKHKEKAEHYKQIYLAFDKMLKAIHPICNRHMEECAKNVLPHSKSGKLKYPESHSIYGATIQDVDIGASYVPGDLNLEDFFKTYSGDFTDIKYGNQYILNLANKIVTGVGTIEQAALETESSFRGSVENPAVPVHRKGKGARPEEITDFEIIFIVGSPNDKDKDKDKKIKLASLLMLQNAIRRRYGDKCKATFLLNEPNMKELRSTFKAVSENNRGTNKKVYAFYIGHGKSRKLEEGILPENEHMQGSKMFEFGCDPIDKHYGLTEDIIKKLYGEFFSNIELISIFPNCQSGAPVTAIYDEKLDLVA